MKCVKPNNRLVCPYCSEKQEYKAIDYIPRYPNFVTMDALPYQTTVQREQCDNCDEFFFVRLVRDMVYTSNLPSKLYDLSTKVEDEENTQKILEGIRR